MVLGFRLLRLHSGYHLLLRGGGRLALYHG
jgi:hypothetical protein